jgi:hypothetical protein
MMTRSFMGVAVGLVLLLTSSGAGKQGAAERKGSVWLTDYGQARQAARESGKPMFVVFRCPH